MLIKSLSLDMVIL